MFSDSDDIIVTGIKPSGEIHLGNYLGAILPLVKLQENYKNLFIFIADIHALTKPILANDLRKYTEELISVYLASGLDPTKCILFKQSDIPAHAQLSQILTCYLDVADLTKMPQYKNYCETHRGEAVPAGMLDYVNWMNADIALYSPDIKSNQKLKVVCGVDQLPHIYSCQEVIKRFNKIYGETFKLPEAIIAKTGAKIMSLSNPSKKMSKSESDKGTIYLLDDVEISRKKIMKAVTDGEGKIYYDPINKPGISNLITIFAILKNLSRAEVEELYRNEKDYGKFKRDVADVVCDEILKIQTKVKQIKDNLILKETLFKGAKKASIIAEKKIAEIYKIIGLK